METKRILNTEKNHQVFSDQTEKPLGSVKDEGKEVFIRLDKKIFEQQTTSELYNSLMCLLLPWLKFDGNPFKASSNKSKSFPHVAFFIESKPHYTGGRYSSLFYAILLSHVTKVTVVSNSPLIFLQDFKTYFNSNFPAVVDPIYLTNYKQNDFDLVIGTPMVSAEFAMMYAKKHVIPYGLIMFESPNYIREFRDGPDSQEEFWNGFKICIPNSKFVILPSKTSERYFKDWSGITKYKSTYVINPAINQVAASEVQPARSDDLFRILFC